MAENGRSRSRTGAVSSSSARFGQISNVPQSQRSDTGTRRPVTGLGEDNNSLSRLSTDSMLRMQSDSRNSVRSLSMANESMQSLLSDIKDVYTERLRKLEGSAELGDDTSRKKVRILQSYVSDLSEQNDILVKTVEELEKEANDRVIILETRLLQNQKETACRQRSMEHEVKALAIEKSSAFQTLDDLRHRYDRVTEDTAGLRDENNDLRHDLNVLIGVITQARATGKWEFSSLDLRVVQEEQVLGPVSLRDSIKSSEQILQGHIGDLKTQLAKRDVMISELQEQLKDMREEQKTAIDQLARRDVVLGSTQSSLASMHDREQQRMVSETDKDITIMKLKTELRQSEQGLADEMEMRKDQEKSNEQLQASIQEIEREMSLLESEKSNHLQTITMLNTKQRESNMELEQVKRELEQKQYATQDNHQILKAETERQERKVRRLEDQMQLKIEELKQRDSKIELLTTELTSSRQENTQIGMSVKDFENELQLSRQKYTNLGAETENLKAALEMSRSSSRDAKDALSAEVAERHDAILKLKSDLSELEVTHRDSMIQMQHRGEVITQLRDEVERLKSLLEESRHKVKRANEKIKTQEQQRNNLQEMVNRLNEEHDSEHSEIVRNQADLSDYQQKLQGLQTELVTLRDRLSESQSQVSYREESIDKLQKQHRGASDLMSKKETALQKLEVQLLTAREEKRRSQEELARKETSLSQLETDLNTTRQQYKDAVEENGRLAARIQAMHITSQSEHEVLSNEASKKDEEIQRSKSEQAALYEQLHRTEERLSSQELSLEQMRHKLQTTTSELKMKDDTIESLERELQDAKSMHSTVREEVERLENTLHEINCDYQSLQNKEESLTQTIRLKEDLISELKNDTETMHQQHRDLLSKMSERDNSIQRLNSENTKFKSKHQSKTSEIQRQSDMMKKLEDSLTKSQLDMENIRRKHQEEATRQVEEIAHLQRELTEAQQQYTSCCEELMKAENLLELTKSDAARLSMQGRHDADELLKLAERVQRQELDLSVTLEKHRTCQTELASRDQSLLRLQSELDTVQQQYQGGMEENKSLQEEVHEQQAKVKSLQNECRDLKDQIEEKERKLTSDSKHIIQLEEERDLGRKDVSK
eukprot:XP_011671157.1 PREDICTED: myosin-11-like isoform X3 [Strongylocentrotus purpuratus]